MSESAAGEGKPLVTKLSGARAYCPFRSKARCTTACPLATQIEDGTRRDDGTVDWSLTGDWQCALACDGQALVEEGKWESSQSSEEELAEKWKKWKEGRGK